MKHSIRYIQVNYTQGGKGLNIQVLRGMELREYSYSAKNSHNLNLLTVGWPTKYYECHIDISRKYKDE